MSPVPPPERRTPWWFTLLLIVLALPLCAVLYFVSSTPEGSTERTLAWLYPVYVAGSVVCARMCYAERPALAWVITALLLLSDIGMWWIC